MILWFAGLAFVIVVSVFRDAAIDYRLVMAGALVPDLVDAPWAHAGPAHALLFSAGLLTVVMLGTRRRRGWRRRLLAVPIGTFVHLILDGAWAMTKVFWWPFLGDAGQPAIPAFGRPAVLVVAMEVAGVAALWWCYRRFELHDAENRDLFLRQGRLRRDLVG